MEKDILLTGGLITLRPYQVSDILYMRRRVNLFPKCLNGCPDVILTIPLRRVGLGLNRNLTSGKKEKNITLPYPIVRVGLCLGGCGLSILDRNIGAANLGYWVRTSQTDKGIATAATLLLTRFAFNKLRLNRVEFTVAVDNQASLRVVEKAGAIKEVILRNRLTKNNTPCDAVVFSLIPQDLE